jgi:hypothetical protein
MIVHHVFQSQQGVHGLKVIGQAIIRSIKIKSLVFDASPEIPLPGDEEAMSVAKVVVERIAVAETIKRGDCFVVAKYFLRLS